MVALLRAECKILPEAKVWMSSLGKTDWDEKPKVARMLGGSFFVPKIRAGLLFKVGSVLTLLLRAVAYLLLPVATGITLLPLAAFLSPEETCSKTYLPEGILRPERMANWLLLEEEAISKNLFGGGRRGLVTVKMC